MRTTSLLIAPIFFLAPFAAAAESPPAAKKLPGVAEAVAPFVEKKEAAGVVTLVTDKAGVVHVDAVGLADVAGNKPMTPDAIMWIASMTKPVTGAAVMMLVDEGKVSIDDPVSKYIPAFADLKTPSGKPANLTVRHILTHTSGLAEAPQEVSRTAKTLADLEPSYLTKPTQFEPGSKWQYCQSGINTAGRIVEVVSGMPFQDFLKKRIFEPLEMKDTTFYLTPEQLPRLAKSYAAKDGALTEAPNRILYGKEPTSTDRPPLANGGLFSTADDYAKFQRMVLNKGTIDGKTYLSPKSVEVMTSVQSGDVVTGFTPGNGWGIGWCVVKQPQGVSEALSPGSSGHGGAYGTQAWIDPVKGRGYVLFVQRSNFPNSDASDLRKAFQNAAAKALEK